MVLLLLSAGAAVSASEPRLSANIPLDSYIYDYLDKFSGLSYLDTVLPGAKPYQRLQVAAWVQEIRRAFDASSNPPAYLQKMLERLESDLKQELAVLNGDAETTGILVHELAWSAIAYSGETLTQRRTVSGYQPLNINANGYDWAEDANSWLELSLDFHLHPRFLLSLRPHLMSNEDDHLDLDLTSAYLKTRLGNLEIFAGKDELWWGQGQRGSLLLTNNSEPKTMLKLSTIEPLEFDGWFRFLNKMDAALFYSELAEDRSDVPSPAFIGYRMDFMPGSDLTFGLAFGSIAGGEGRALHGSDFWDLLRGDNKEGAEERWNSIAGVDFRWRLPGLMGLQLYAEIYGEDQAEGIIPAPSKTAELLGVYIPRITADGRWDLTLEAAKNDRSWYRHSLYSDGYVDRGHIMGDAMGNDAERYYVALNRYSDAGNRLGLNFEYLSMDQDAAFPQSVASFWLTYEMSFLTDWRLAATAGVSHIRHPGYEDTDSDWNYLLGLELGWAF